MEKQQWLYKNAKIQEHLSRKEKEENKIYLCIHLFVDVVHILRCGMSYLRC